jgi:lipopolysaccharide export system protein LptA
MTPLPSLKSSVSAASLALLTAAISSAVGSGIAAEPAQKPTQAAADPAGLVTIESDVQQADNQTGIVTATGNVRITYPDRGMVATSRQAQYFSREGRLVLTGDVDVIDADGQRIRAERLTYNLDQERLLAQPSDGKQVTSKLRMKSATTPRVGPPMP